MAWEWFDSPGPCCSHPGEHLPQPGRAGSTGNQDHCTEGLPGGAVLSLQRPFLLSIFICPLCSHTSGARSGWAGLLMAAPSPCTGVWGGVTAPPSPCWRTSTGATPSPLPPQWEEIHSWLHRSFMSNCGLLPGGMGGISASLVWPCSLAEVGGCVL